MLTYFENILFIIPVILFLFLIEFSTVKFHVIKTPRQPSVATPLVVPPTLRSLLSHTFTLFIRTLRSRGELELNKAKKLPENNSQFQVLFPNSKLFQNMSKKVAVFHHFFKGDCKGGGEKLVLQMREYYQADLWVGGVDLAVWGKENAQKDPDFVGKVWDERFGFFYLHEESHIPIWKHIKRQLFFLFSPKVRELANYDLVIFSFGNIAFVPQRLNKILGKKSKNLKRKIDNPRTKLHFDQT